MEARIANDQYGFQKNKGNIETILRLAIILEN